MTADETVRNDSGEVPAPRPPPSPGPLSGATSRPPAARASGPRPSAHPVGPRPRASNPHQFGRVDDDGTVWLISAAGERVVGSWQAGDREAAFAHFGRRFDDLATEVTLMEERLAAGTGDARKIKGTRVRAGRDPADGRPCWATSTRLAGRLTSLAEQAECHGRRGALPARGASGRADRPQGGAGRRGRGTWPPTRDAVEGRGRSAPRDPRRVENHQRSGPQSRRRVVEALFRGPGGLQPAAGFPFRRVGSGTLGDPAGQRTPLRAGRRVVGVDRLDRHQRRISQAAHRMESGGPSIQRCRRRPVAPLQGRPGRVFQRT